MNIHQLSYATCVTLTGLIAGLFYGYQCSVVNGLGSLADKEYLAAFQGINKAILNPLFFLSFLGTLVLMAITVYCSHRCGATHVLPFLITAAAVYGIGVFGITILFNVPLNEMLAAFDLEAATGQQLHEMRLRFEAKWNLWHLIRTIASILSFILLCLPLIRRL